MKIKSGTVKLIITAVLTVCVILAVYFSFPAIIKLLSYVINLFLPFILGYAFAALIRPIVELLQKKLKIPRELSTILVMIFILGILGSIVGFAIYKIVNEVRNVYYHFPSIYENIRLEIIDFRESVAGLLNYLPDNFQYVFTAFTNDITEKLGTFLNGKSVPVMESAGGIAKAMPKILVATVVFLLSSFFMVSDFELVSKTIKKVFTVKGITKLEKVKAELKNYLGGYIRAQGIIMSIAFLIMLVSFRIIGVEYGLVIAIGVAFLDALPFFGSGAVLWPWSIISFVNGDLRSGFGLIITYVIIVTTRQFIEPKIISSNIGLHPLLTLMSMYVGYKTLSIGGMIFGPIILMVFISFYRAGVFDGIIKFFKGIWIFIKAEILEIKNYIKKIWESE